ncbi:MAG: SDR family NAD(P)-dependent oxidoreductase [Candidatus Faecousia sp.]|nr:SDR family NAD(P)-dependent oxidoreductase [Candidatus Faecousia sp.]
MDFSSVQGKVAIVTGASRGIGRATAEVFAENGMKVVCAARSADQGQAVVDEIVRNGGDAIFLQADCSNAQQLKALVDAAMAHYGRLDGVVSNAGMGMGGTPLHEYEMADYNKIFSLNSEGVFAGMKYGAEAIFKSKSQSGRHGLCEVRDHRQRHLSRLHPHLYLW